eukprot:CAMPEP_0115834018 /NCGR_PEP_ID=MMETSP0287-20121206/3470_1 /TAXON_ID=412157 /ORGANISM="Chrysochromulina rotalis, Strain UIO044" /LENGTH=56 /DNA_ID=CAMNT_0003287447 /DNA_START=21 /DNA_END=191 /DNA_ORIENTATION=+
MKLLGNVAALGGVMLVLLNQERIFKFVTRNHDALTYQKDLVAAGQAKAHEMKAEAH